MTTPTTVQLRYRRGDASADEINAAVAEILDELDDPSGAAAQEAGAAGIDVGALTGVTVEVREGAQGLEPFLTSIVVNITVGATAGMAEALWTRLIWPRVRRRLGVRAILDRQYPSGDQPPR